MTWEESVIWLRNQPDKADLVRACYFDDPLTDAAKRYAAGTEWASIRKLFPNSRGEVLDIGAGRGISSYALAQDGWDVTALEPDPSPLVGAGAIRSLSSELSVPIKVVEEWGEKLPFSDETFDLVFGRQVLHHAHDLGQFCREVSRVLKPGGRFIATREHVISRSEDLQQFLSSHPLHHCYCGENAYMLRQYLSALTNAKFTIVKVLAPYDDVINYYPLSESELKTLLIAPFKKIVGKSISSMLVDERWPWGKPAYRTIVTLRSRLMNGPGRLYSFVAEKRNAEREKNKIESHCK